MDKVSINFVCSAIALLGGDKDLIDIVRDMNEETNFENIDKYLKWFEKKTQPIIDKGLNYELRKVEEEWIKDGLDIDDNPNYFKIFIEKKEIATYHKSQQHSQES